MLGGENFASTTEYDSWGREVRETHQRGSGMARSYDRRYSGTHHRASPSGFCPGAGRFTNGVGLQDMVVQFSALTSDTAVMQFDTLRYTVGCCSAENDHRA
ncbi:hypothetical protein [Pseudoduganella rhizocola]|uniref:hypothetical protein n=1 Tax=Pseudoduganella rhizocola TaxID=3382643 RepID=UPI0038B66E45